MLLRVLEVGGNEHAVGLGSSLAKGADVYAAVAAVTKCRAQDIRLLCKGRRLQLEDSAALADGETVVMFRKREEPVKDGSVRIFIRDEIVNTLKQYETKAEGTTELSAEEQAELQRKVEGQLKELIAALFVFSATTGGSLDVPSSGIRARDSDEEMGSDDEEMAESALPEAEITLPEGEEEEVTATAAADPSPYYSAPVTVSTSVSDIAQTASEQSPVASASVPPSASASASPSTTASGSGEVDLSVDEASQQQLMEMGFSEVAARKALLLNGSNTEQALNWLLEHSCDDDINEPLTHEQMDRLAQEQRQFAPDAGAMQQLLDMGFPREEVVQALRACDNNYEAACSWLLGDRVELPRHQRQGPAANPMLDVFSTLTQGSLMKAIKGNPSLEQALRNPKTLEKLQYLTLHPEKVADYVNDPLVGSIISDIFRIIRMAFSGR